MPTTVTGKFSKPQVVLVNDDQAQLTLISRLLEREGISAQTFTKAEDALAAMGRDGPPDLIITDIYMPGIDGWRFCRLLRSPEYAALNQVPLLVVSATFAGEETSRIAAELHANAFLPVPFNARQFSRQIRALLNGAQARIKPGVLIVEDSRALAGALQKAFNAHGYYTETATTLAEAGTAFDSQLFEIVVIDYHLPDGDGDALLETFRRKRPDCVCIMITTDPNPDLALDWMKRGAAAYLRKPFKGEYLVELCARARRERALLRAQDLLNERTTSLKRANQRLHRSEERLQLTMEAINDGIWDWHLPSGKAVFSNTYYTMLGYEPGEFPATYESWRALLHPEDRTRVEREIREKINLGENFTAEMRLRTKSGGWRWILARGRVVETDEKGRPLRMVGTHVDISERKIAEQDLRESQERYRMLFDSAGDAIFIHNADFHFLAANRQACEQYGYTIQEITSMHLMALDREVSQELAESRVNELLTKGWSKFETALSRSDGTPVPVEVSARCITWKNQPAVMSICHDISERKTAEQKIQQALKEKETLLRELYHRTKNNMQVISSMLSLQAAYTANATVTQAFREMETRIQSMALVHQKLYQTRDLSLLDLQDYLRELTAGICRSYNVSEKQVQVQLDISPMRLLIDVATPCGLIISELMSNALKYAFPQNRPGVITIRVSRTDPGGLELYFADNGVGLPRDCDTNSRKTLGLQIIRALTEQQLRGQATFINKNGLACRIRFKDDSYKQRI